MFRKLLLVALFCLPSFSFAALTRPKLALVIVIDQFRSDYLSRFQSSFLPAKGKDGSLGGFQYLMKEGAYYPSGQYEIMQSMTAPGHATILSGSYPYQAGIPINGWYDSKSEKPVYCTDDSEFPWIGTDGLVATKKEKGPTGSSPNQFLATTIGDELKTAGFPSKVFAVALKDRASILLAGHRADLALWFEPETQQWISSKYYVPEGSLPPWVKKLNQESAVSDQTKLTWETKGNGSGYSATDAMPLTTQRNAGKLGGAKFPHLAAAKVDYVMSTPYGLKITEKAAEYALKENHLGQGKATDLLAVSFSSFDMIGHAFGPNSREAEEMAVQSDLVISKLLNQVNKTVPGGMKNVLVILTGDHGAPPSPEWAAAQKIKAGRIEEEALTQSLNEYLDDKFGKSKKGNWISYSVDFNFYINRAALADKEVSQSKIEMEAKNFLLRNPHIAFVFTETEYKLRQLPPGIHERQILHTYYPGRSGEIILIPKPYFIPGGKKANTSTHITGYSYDRSVPIILAGSSIRKGTFAENANVVDIAPTLSFLLGTLAPSLSEGRILSEAIDTKDRTTQ